MVGSTRRARQVVGIHALPISVEQARTVSALLLLPGFLDDSQNRLVRAWQWTTDPERGTTSEPRAMRVISSGRLHRLDEQHVLRASDDVSVSMSNWQREHGGVMVAPFLIPIFARGIFLAAS